MSMRAVVITILAIVVAVAAAPPAEAAGPGEREQFVYRWELTKLASLVGGILLPGEGKGTLTSTPVGGGRIETELLITSEKSRDGEFWRYGAEIDPRLGRAVEAWSSYLFRGKKKSKREPIADEGVLDIASAIYQIRKSPPSQPRTLRIWSEGKIYPVRVVPRGDETRTLPGDRRVATRRYSVEPLQVAGMREWKGSMELWIAKDEAATPVEILVQRPFAGVQLQLDPGA